ncbi:voltage-gated chloride channel family protein [Mucilaginibacter sp. RB4R14]|uniref:voltage-gated chloride channel family protein n=1 Tax=Mucilaginibacter aurantiaciroseus TaxID=2949308 RepID=UPI00209150BE|nr:voltage-gated chloride channel family protein [Mucilaginibacter aurantiaciroseus]MCO5937258.1 voltage-gated chloride channel family protein [Mucilaginibacter aurantiaciroseus]
MFKNIVSNSISLIKYLVRWGGIIVPVAAAIGSVVAFFLWLLSWAIHFRFAHTWLLYLLPAAGVVIHLLYKWYGKSAERGNNLIIDEIHQPGAGVPKRMAPLILVTTVITHLFGGSAGREGTAVQIGGSLANLFGSWFKMNESDKKIILSAGVAAGFGAVFGTPLTGAIFALEVIVIGRVPYKAFFACLIAGYVGDITVSLWGIHHTLYHVEIVNTGQTFYGIHLPVSFWLLAKVILASAIFGGVSYAFVQAVHLVKNFSLRWIKITWVIPVVGGLAIIGLTYILGKPDYLGLGVDAEYIGAVTIASAFQHAGADAFSWLWKLVYTAITLGTGFKGGEVTPLFYIGSTLGNSLAELMNAPVGLFAALGFIAVFAGATNTPLACTLLGIELFGGEYAIFFAIACFTAYFFSGDGGIYSAQKVDLSKAGLTKSKYLKRMFGKYRL